MNPPFSAALHVKGPAAGTDFRHVRAALHRLAPGGRLVTLTGANVSPHHPDYRQAFAELEELGRVVFSAGISGALYRRHGTTIETRLTVIDRVPASESPGDVTCHPMAESAEALLDLVTAHVPARQAAEARLFTETGEPVPSSRPDLRRPQGSPPPAGRPVPRRAGDRAHLYMCRRSQPAGRPPRRRRDLRSLPRRDHPHRGRQAPPHQARPVGGDGVRQAAEALLPPASPRARRHRGPPLRRPARKRHPCRRGAHPASRRTLEVGASLDVITAADAGDDAAVRFRRGWFLGDGTGAGKGRQVAGILLDNWLKGRRRALWVSKSDKLIEDAQRDWTALGQEKLHIVPPEPLPPGQADHAERRHPLHDLRHAPLVRTRRQGLPPQADHRLAGGRVRGCRGVRRRHRVRRVPRHGQRRRRQDGARRTRRLPARARGTPSSARAARRPRRLCVRDRRHDRREPRLHPAPWLVGRRLRLRRRDARRARRRRRQCTVTHGSGRALRHPRAVCRRHAAGRHRRDGGPRARPEGARPLRRALALL